MNKNHFTHHFFMVLLVHVSLTRGEVCYITPTQNVSCPEQPCPTLSQLAADSNKTIRSSTSITLLFLLGSHSLDCKLVLTNVNNISMTNVGGSVQVNCTNQSGRFEIGQADIVSISGLHFMGCGGNLVTQVNQFTLKDTIFQGMRGSGTALLVNGTDCFMLLSKFNWQYSTTG